MTVNPLPGQMPANRALYILQAARGPVILITVGALFAMDQAGMLGFGRTWPLLLIVLGVMKLLERVVAPAVPAPPFGAQRPYAAPPYPHQAPFPQQPFVQAQPPYGPPPPPPPAAAPPPPAAGGRRL